MSSGKLGDRVPSDPEPTIDTIGYWQAAQEGRLMIGSCKACGAVHFYPRTRCPFCFDGEAELIEASGKGEIYSYSIMRRAAQPYAIAYVRLDEGVTMMSNIVDCAPEDIHIGARVEAVFQPSVSGQNVVMFKPAR